MMDQIDRHIIGLLQENARISNKEISQKVSLSAPAVAERIRKLENEGILTGYHATINPEKIGKPLQAIINMSLKVSNHSKFYDLIDACDAITECYHVTGTYCMSVKVCVVNMHELESIIHRLQQVGSTNTQMILSTHILFKPIN